nr:aprataxin and PNK-like factor isoform X1 [Pogona vitticeps]
MSGFELAPVDGGCPVVLPPGETVIGRGALLGITDKRVSRKHAILKVAGNQLSIKPVHINPCFYRPNENGQLLPLDTDKWHQLSSGDSFSLLVDKYVFKILFSPSESLQRKNCSHNVEDMSDQIPATLQSTKMPHRQPAVQEIKFSSKSQFLEGYAVLEKATEIPNKHSTTICDTEKQHFTQRKRALPAWMLQTDVTMQNPSASVPERGDSEKIKKAHGKKKITENEAGLETQHVQGTSIKPDVERIEKAESRSVPQGTESSAERCNRLLENEEPGLNLDVQTCQSTRTGRTGNRLESINSKPEWDSQDEASASSVHQGEIQDRALNQATERDVSNLAGSQGVSQSSNIPRHQRTACQYGRSCYRKNPIHFQQFSHPGDSDYYVTEAVSQADTDNRPECPYGVSCYRKNPQHRLEYKHTAPPESERRQTRPKAAKKGRWAFSDKNAHDDESDGCNPSDSFLDHEESEKCDSTDEDSDWDPDIEDQDNEDFDTLLKEAQNFAKSKK